ncbi:MAG: beta-glucosidase [Solirubrobacteraceae bacterium]
MRIRALFVGIGAMAAGAGFAGGGTATAGTPHRSCPWMRSHASVPRRVAQVMGRMTLSDKLQLVHGTLQGYFTTSGPVYAGSTAAIPSLCIPALNLQDGPAGVGDGFTHVTQLPSPVGLSATWDPRLARAYGAVVGAEQRGKGANVDLGPTVNIVRDPRWGRAFETYGEDPYLMSAVGVGYIKGAQAQGVMTQVKHLAAYAEETGRDGGRTSDAIVSQRALQEIYLPPFQAAVSRAHVASLMCAYNDVNHQPACQSGYLLHQVLHEQFRFPGFVTSDWFATQSVAPSADSGLDMQMPDGCYFGPGLRNAVGSGAVPRSRVDDMVRRILTEMFRFHQFGRGQEGGPSHPVTTSAHRAVALKVAEASTVLLKNAHRVLPLRPGAVRSIAVIGADGGSGAYSAGGGSAAVVASHVVTPYEGITARAPHGVKVTYDDGSSTSSAAAAARAASVAVVFVDLPEGESQDLPSIDLPGNDNTLISDVAAANPRTIVVLNTGSAVPMPWLDSVAGVLEAWYPGQEDGRAIASLLFGGADPGGKLPVTFPVSLSQTPASSPAQWPGAGQQDFSEGIFVGYRYYQAHHERPLFPFGYGLSYTSFRIGSGRVTRAGRSGHFRISVTVTNTGRRRGSDVVQLYVGDPQAAGEPPRQLEGFRRLTLAPGKRTRVSFQLSPRNLSYWKRRWVATRGTYHLYVGDSSASLPVHMHVRLTRTIASGRRVGPPPHLGTDSPTLARDCPKDTLAPDVAAILTGTGDIQAALASLP